jgi:hypothetical protein
VVDPVDEFAVFVDAGREARELVVLRVDVRGELLQEDDQVRLERQQRARLIAGQCDGAGDRFAPRAAVRCCG